MFLAGRAPWRRTPAPGQKWALARAFPGMQGCWKPCPSQRTWPRDGRGAEGPLKAANPESYRKVALASQAAPELLVPHRMAHGGFQRIKGLACAHLHGLGSCSSLLASGGCSASPRVKSVEEQILFAPGGARDQWGKCPSDATPKPPSDEGGSQSNRGVDLHVLPGEVRVQRWLHTIIPGLMARIPACPGGELGQ